MKKYIIIAVVFVLLASCGSKEVKTVTEEIANESLVELTDAQLKNSEIKTGKIEQRNISSILKVNGKKKSLLKTWFRLAFQWAAI